MRTICGIILAAISAFSAVGADLEDAVSRDIVTPVRPGGVNGQEFWNGNALWFMYPPSFDFKPVRNAVSYRFSVRDNFQREWTMSAPRPTEPIVDVWTNLPPGLTVATCYGVDGEGEVVGLAGTRSFWKQAPFKPGACPKAKRTYREAAHKLLSFLVDDWKPAQTLLKTGRPNISYQYNGYPAKIGSALVNIMLMAARELPEKSVKAIDLARKEADYLISITPTEGPLAYFTPTYEYHPEAEGPNRHAPKACKRLEGQCMIRYCAEVGIALLRLAKATGDRKYADFAVKCGETFLRLQRPDGTWPCVMRYSDGASMRRDDAILIERINFFTMLRDWTGDARYAKLEDDVFSQLERSQMRTWDWQGQFEDTSIAAEPYKDLTGTDALPAACYILKRFPGDAKRLSQAIEMIRFGEDQFTCWERPCRADGGSPSMGQVVEGKWYDSTYPSWHCPGVGEQYACMVPIDASACRMIWGYLALHRATGDRLAFAKALALGNSLVNRQQENGGIDTYWYDTGMRTGDGCDEIDWLDCMMDDAEALLDLAASVPQTVAKHDDETTKVLKTGTGGDYVLERIASLPVACTEVRTVKGREASLLPEGRRFRLVWHDEFDGNSLDESKWSYRTNFWGRRAHWFAAPEDNAVEVKDGLLRLKLVKKADGQFISPQLQTGELMWDIPHAPNPSGFWPLPKRERPKFVRKYGYYECRCRLQRMPGWWSAFWMQSESQGVTLDPGASGIEHDIMESFDPGEVIVAAFHMNGYGQDYKGFHIPAAYDDEPKFEGKLNLAVDVENFHTFGLLWEPDGYSVYVDGRLRGRNGAAVSHVPEFVLLTTEAKWYRNNRMTGEGVPELDAAARAGDDFVVDYVRVYDIVEEKR